MGKSQSPSLIGYWEVRTAKLGWKISRLDSKGSSWLRTKGQHTKNKSKVVVSRN